MSIFEPGQISRDELNRLQRNRDNLLADFTSARRQLAECETSIQNLHLPLLWARNRRRSRDRYRIFESALFSFVDRSVTRVGGSLIAIALFLALVVVFGSNLGSYGIAFIILLLAAVVVVAPLVYLRCVPSDRVLDDEIARASAETMGHQSSRIPLSTAADQARRRLDEAEATFSDAEHVFLSRLNQILTCKWSELSGVPFENFLADVFSELGWHVQSTKASGDQGVDLLVTRAARRIAIQAKGYQSGSVGNHAVMEVHAGKTHYQCNEAIVITNSTFTSAAKELARSVGCMLIDRTQIPSLIRGQLEF